MMYDIPSLMIPTPQKSIHVDATPEEKNAASAASFLLIQGLQTPNIVNANYVHLARQGYGRSKDVYAAINVLTNAISQIPLVVVKRGDVQGEPLLEHPLQQLIDKPNPTMARAEFMREVAGYFFLAGNSYIAGLTGAISNREGRPVMLLPVQPDRIGVDVRKGKFRHIAVAYKIDQQPELFTPEEILHLKTFNPLNEVEGLPPLSAAAMSVDLGNEGRLHNVSLMQNDARPSGAIQVKGKMDRETYNRTRRMLEERIMGTENAGMPMVLHGGAEWKQMGLTARDLDWLKSMGLSLRDIAAIFGVPPQMIGDTESQKFKNFAEARKSLYEDTVIPWLSCFLDELNMWLTPRIDPSVIIRMELKGLPAFRDDQVKLWEMIDSDEVLTVNEKRRMKGKDDIDGGDVVLIEANQIPLTDAGTQANAAGNNAGAKAIDLKSAHPNPKKPKKPRKLAERDLVRAWKTIDSKRNQWIRKNIREIKAEFNRERIAIKKALAQSDGQGTVPIAINQVLIERRPIWKEFLESLYQQVGIDFARSTFENVQKMADHVQEFKTDQNETFFNLVQGYFEESGGVKLVKRITETTRDQLAVTLIEGLSVGESIFKLSQRVDTLYLDNIIENRSKTIARTETIRASNFGAQKGAEQLTIPTKKRWLTTRDDRTRSLDRGDKFDHLVVDGQTVDTEIPFNVQGEKLMFPSDTRLGATAANTINCRCTQIFIPIEEDFE